MLFNGTSLPPATIIQIDARHDERGYFARTMCRMEFERHGLLGDYVQSNHVHSKLRGTVRGMHFQRTPYQEAKLVRCIKGLVYDVIIDLRSDSPTYARWEGFHLSPADGRILYVPPGFAHGYQTLQDDTDVIYFVSAEYTPSHEGGIRYNDPAFGIIWPEDVSVISAKDASWPDFRDPCAPL